MKKTPVVMVSRVRVQDTAVCRAEVLAMKTVIVVSVVAVMRAIVVLISGKHAKAKQTVVVTRLA